MTSTATANWPTDRALLLDAAESLRSYDRGCLLRMVEKIDELGGLSGSISEATTIRYSAATHPQPETAAALLALANRIQGA